MKELLIRAASGDVESDGRNLYGVAVHYESPSLVADHWAPDQPYLEMFSRSAFNKTLSERGQVPIPLGFGHPWSLENTPKKFRQSLGDVTFESTPSALLFHVRMHETPLGDKALGMVKDGSWSDVSMGFHSYKDQDIDGIKVRTEVGLYELSLAPTGKGLHKGAEVLAIRAAMEDGLPLSCPRLEMLTQLIELNLWDVA